MNKVKLILLLMMFGFNVFNTSSKFSTGPTFPTIPKHRYIKLGRGKGGKHKQPTWYLSVNNRG